MEQFRYSAWYNSFTKKIKNIWYNTAFWMDYAVEKVLKRFICVPWKRADFLNVIINFGSLCTGLISAVIAIVADNKPDWNRTYVAAFVCFSGFLIGLIYITPVCKVQISWEDHKICRKSPTFYWNYLVTKKQIGRWFFFQNLVTTNRNFIWVNEQNIQHNFCDQFNYGFIMKSLYSWGFLLRQLSRHQLCKRQLFSQKFNCWL